jgi:hypothetical protein
MASVAPRPAELSIRMILAGEIISSVRLNVEQNQLVSDRWKDGLGIIGLQGA